jgi:spore germination cell wall hydrolase CwlJ-like protein
MSNFQKLLVIFILGFLFGFWSVVVKAATPEIRCLAENIYYEARDQPISGQVAVAFVTLNRVNHRAFPNSICRVVKQRRLGVCQFTWVCVSQNREFNLTAWRKALVLAEGVVINFNYITDPTYGALYYHADYVEGHQFFEYLFFTNAIGNHYFYK